MSVYTSIFANISSQIKQVWVIFTQIEAVGRGGEIKL